MNCKPDCEICGGVGVIRYDVEVTHPEFGKLHPCPNLDKKQLPHYSRSGLHKSEQEFTWGDVWDLPDSNMQKAIQAVKMSLDRRYGFIFISGTWGNGKSHLLKVAVSLSLAKGRKASYVNTADVIEVMRESQFDPDMDNAKHDIEYWANCQVLALDEFDKVRDTEYATEKRFRLLDARYVMATRMQNVTILASNTPANQFHGEIHSRLNDGRAQIIELSGKDVRPAMDYPEDPLAEEIKSAFETGE